MSKPFKLVTSTMNHRPEPEFQGVWYPYLGGRMKDPYDLKLKDGTILRGWYPNACAWFSHNKVDNYEIGRVEDADVAEIRLMTDEEIEEICYFGFTGEERLKRNISYFGDILPKVIRNADGTTTLEPRVYRQFEEMVCSSWDGDFTFSLARDEMSEEELEDAVMTGRHSDLGFHVSLDYYIRRAGSTEVNPDVLLCDVNPYQYFRSLYLEAKDKITEQRHEQEKARIKEHITRNQPQKQKNRNRKGTVTPVVLWDKKTDGLTGKARRKLEKKRRREEREKLNK